MATQIAAQMYTLRDHCKTPSDLAVTCGKLKKLGFGALQGSAGCFNTIAAKELKQILDDQGLVCCATHRSLDQLENAAAEIDYHQIIGCELTAIGGFGWEGENTAQVWESFAARYNGIAKKYAAAKLRIGYHNHSHELSPFGITSEPGKINPKHNPLSTLLAKCDPSVWFEIDTYWISHGGADPALWIDKCSGRLPAMHVKDMSITPSREHKMCEVGAGNLNWPRILDAAKKAGVKWYIIERDQGDLDPFESLKISLDNLKAMGLN
jgi:sugar phosphate isomerase/epimerase